MTNGSYYNEITNNYIGTDVTGSIGLPNGNGIGFSSFPKHNLVDGNIISGNNEIGVIILDTNCIGNTIFREGFGCRKFSW